MDLIDGILNTFQPANLLYCFVGCVLGTLVGVLPGLGPASTLSILLPITLYLDPTGAILMLAGLYYGAAYGGSTTSILVNIPGELGAVPTCFDGFPMTKNGRAGEALWMAAVASFIAGTFGTIALSIIGPSVAKYALKFGPPEYAALLLFSLTALISLSGTSLAKGIAVGVAGMLLATIGIDPLTGAARFNYGQTLFTRGFDLVSIVVGLFGISEILSNFGAGTLRIYSGKIGKMMPRGKELKKGLVASVRGTLVGFPLGLLPGVTPGVTAFLAYDVERRFSKTPEKFGTGVIEGVAAAESANNATAQAGFLPLVALGIPTGPSLAIILAALMMYGLQPGPVLFEQNKLLIWTVIGSMYIGNVMLLLLNLPLVGVWARVSTMPYKYLAPIILAVCVIGAYSTRNTMFDVWVALAAGVLGFVMKARKWPLTPFILGYVLGPLFEAAFRQSLSMGGPLIFFTRYISIGFIFLAVATVAASLLLRTKAPAKLLKENAGEL